LAPLKATELIFGHNMRRTDVLLIAKFQTIRPRKTPHAKENHGSVQVVLHPINNANQKSGLKVLITISKTSVQNVNSNH